jgi:hypothetical protein
VDFYDDVLRELVFALGAALFVANVFALYRRHADARQASDRSLARHRPGSPVRGYARKDEAADLAQAPVARSVTYMIIGFVVMIAGLAAIVTK